MRFENRVAVVTGAGRGIGLATARLLAAEGACVVPVDVNPTLVVEGGVLADVARAEDVDRLFSVVEARFGRLDILVANAGLLYQKTTLTAAESDWERCLDVNLKSVWLCARRAHALLEQSGHGSIVTVASAQGLRANRSSFPYSAAKGGLLALTRSLAVEYAPRVRANAVIPGQVESVRTEPFFQSFRNPDEARRRVLSTFPMGRLGKPEDIAKAIAFLASDDAAWITGAFLHVDGGRDAALLDLSDLKAPR